MIRQGIYKGAQKGVSVVVSHICRPAWFWFWGKWGGGSAPQGAPPKMEPASEFSAQNLGAHFEGANQAKKVPTSNNNSDVCKPIDPKNALRSFFGLR